MSGSMIRKAILAVAVLATGAGGLAAAPSVVSGGDTTEFTDCMRAHGLPDFPEVAVSADGLVNLTINGERVDVLSKKYGAAVKACEPLLPDGVKLPGAPTAPAAPSPPPRVEDHPVAPAFPPRTEDRPAAPMPR